VFIFFSLLHSQYLLLIDSINQRDELMNSGRLTSTSRSSAGAGIIRGVFWMIIRGISLPGSCSHP
jgi:hypothetical protein